MNEESTGCQLWLEYSMKTRTLDQRLFFFHWTDYSVSSLHIVGEWMSKSPLLCTEGENLHIINRKKRN